MVFAQHGALRSLAAGKARNRNSGMISIDHAGSALADAIDDEGVDVDEIGDRFGHVPLRYALAREDQRYTHRLLIKGRLPPQSALADGIAVVADVDDAGVRRQPRGSKRIEHLSGLLVHEAAEPEVTGDCPSNIILRLEIIVEIERVGVVAHEGMVGPLFRRIE